MREFSELQTIELKQGLLAQYFSGKGCTSHPDGLLYRVEFSSGIPYYAIVWCSENCLGKWGWLHLNIEPHKTVPHCEKSYLLFEFESEAIHFKLQLQD